MANAPGVNDKSDKSAKPAKPAKAGLPKQPLVDERFWKRYSPHGELPLSGAGSFALHALIVGFLVLWAVYLAAYFSKPSRNLPVESVRLDLGGTAAAAAARATTRASATAPRPSPTGKRTRSRATRRRRRPGPTSRRPRSRT
jgi:hypothetical protein